MSKYVIIRTPLSIGSTNGPHDIWVGLRGLPSDATPTWDETTVILDSNTPAITITSPSNNVSFNASRVDVSGTFSAGQLQQITVNGVLVFINGTNFEALNVPLAGGTNTVTAIVQDFNGDTNTAKIYVVGVTNSDGSLNDPIELSATNVGGFYPLTVTFQVQTNFPGIFSNLFYDFNGDDIADFTTNNFAPLTYTYPTNGVYFPVATVQTSVGRFSSLGGSNSLTPVSTNGTLQINVQASPVLVSTISITDPVDLKWTASSNLYVLSGSTATITLANWPSPFVPLIKYSPTPTNAETWACARAYEYAALTNSANSNRASNMGCMFYALGHILHLNEDLSQPDHVRNDEHVWGYSFPKPSNIAPAFLITISAAAFPWPLRIIHAKHFNLP
jgi:hypothetical protein